MGMQNNLFHLITPCFIFDEKDFIKNLVCFQRVLNKYFKKSLIGYSFKTNALPYLLSVVKNQGVYAEVVSADEYQLAEKMGFSPDRIIYNGPVKEKETFRRAIENGSIVNIDSKREIQWLAGESLPFEKKVGIRVNFDLESLLPGSTSTGNLGGRFGFCYENGDLKKAIHQLKSAGIGISGLHMHVSNATKSVDVYRVLASIASKIIKEEHLEVDYIDFGGGFFGGGDDGEQYERYVKAIHEELIQNSLDDIRFIVEPGASVVATSFSYLTRVVDYKDTTYGRFVITDGSRLHLDPFLGKSKYSYQLITNSASVKDRQCICGYTCMEKDRIMTLENAPELKIGDLIHYHVTGSYSMCFNALFISYLPTVYKVKDERYEVVRSKWTVNEFLQGSVMCK